jgi:hypothetical protein
MSVAILGGCGGSGWFVGNAGWLRGCWMFASVLELMFTG